MMSLALIAIYSACLIADKTFRRIRSCTLQIWLERMRYRIKYENVVFMFFSYINNDNEQRKSFEAIHENEIINYASVSYFSVLRFISKGNRY
jgi:hypothetical protein